MNQEYKRVVLAGLQRLMTLRLQGHPPAETIRAVGEVWLDALHSCGDWNDPRHIQALGEAFQIATRECERFPSPAEIRKRKPQVVNTFKALPTPPKTSAEKAEIDRIFKEIFNTLDINSEET